MSDSWVKVVIRPARWTLIDEQIHHGAEIDLLRDLYVRRGGASRIDKVRLT